MSTKGYPSDSSDAEWAFVAPYLALITENAPQRKHDLRRVYDALKYVVRTGIPWRFLPGDFPPWAAVYQQARRWLDAGAFEAMTHDLREIMRFGQARKKTPTGVVLDARVLKSSVESGHRAAWDGHKRMKGSKIHIAVDSLGHLLAAVVTGTARERSWVLRGPAIVRVAAGKVPVGRYDLVGRVEAVEAHEDQARQSTGAGARRDDAGQATALLSARDEPAVVMGPGTAQPTIRVVAGGPPVTIDLDGRTVAGRGAEAQVRLQDSTVSREHAAFVRRATGWRVVDLGSMNGTKVNGRLAGEHELSDRDSIELGEAVLEFRER